MLSPLSPSTYSALGYVQTLTGELTNAVESFHKVLVTNMLTLVIEKLINFPSFPNTTPQFPSP